MLNEPLFTRHIAGLVLRAPIELLETRLDLGIRDRFSQRGDPVGREAPVIVVSRAVLPLVNFGIRDAPPREEMNRFNNGPVKRSAHVHQDSVDVKDHQLGRKLQRISSIARSRRRVSARVPALMRTNPSRGKSFRSRTRIPFRSSARTRRCAPGPKSTRTKFAALG